MTSNSAQNQQNVCSKKTVAQSQQLSPQVNRSYQLPKFMPPVEAPEKPKKKKWCCIVTLLVLMVVFGVLGFGCYRYGGKEETKAENKEPEIIEMWRVHMETAEMTAILEMRGLLPEDLDKELTNAMKKVGKVSLFHERDVREAYLKRTGLGAAHDKLVNLVKENDLYQEYRRVSPDACLDKATNMYQAMAKSIGEQLAAAAQNGW